MKWPIVFALILSAPAWAEPTVEVKKVNSTHTKVLVSGPETKNLKEGDRLVYEDSFGESCVGEVKKNENGAIVDISTCANPKIIQVGTKMVPTTKPLAPPSAPAKPISAVEKQYQESGLKSINESWYTLWGLGLSSVRYPGQLNDAMEAADDTPGVSRSTINLDFLGFYWPIQNHSAMVGVIINATADSLSYDGGEFAFYQYTLAASYQRFFGTNIGDGWFVRGDLGAAWYRMSIDTSVFDADESSDKGLGFMVGGGYSFAIGTETRLPVGIYYAHRDAENNKITSLNLTVGFLF